jgi:replication factor C subunit 3/5
MSTNIPWVEKYRPAKFEEIVLDPINRQIFRNILNKNYFPNLLFYGPPGTGKTTTIINIIHEYQRRKNEKINSDNVIHLNASDERGIDIIRNQIHQFVRSKTMFKKGIKFVILDEVDYMTKNAQHALKYLLQMSSADVRFCLICNYISKIDESLKNEFLCIRFNQLPKTEIDAFLKHVAESEQISLTDGAIDTIQRLFQSDIRSMINYIQLNNGIPDWQNNIITDAVYDKLRELFSEKRVDLICAYLQETVLQYNLDKRNILNNYFNYIVRKRAATPALLNAVETILHTPELQIDDAVAYLVSVST